MLIHYLRSLRPAIAIRVVEIQRADAMSAGYALERNTAVHRFGCVITHLNIVTPYSLKDLGH